MTTQGYNQPAEIPRELDKWSWGAFFLNWIWGLGNGTYIALLMWVPFVNLIMIFILGARGNAWAWKNRPWRDVDHFKRVQKAWALWGLASWVLVIGGTFVRPVLLDLRDDPQGQRAISSQRWRRSVPTPLCRRCWVTTSTTAPSLPALSTTSGGSGKAELVFSVKAAETAQRVTTRSVRENGDVADAATWPSLPKAAKPSCSSTRTVPARRIDRRLADRKAHAAVTLLRRVLRFAIALARH